MGTIGMLEIKKSSRPASVHGEEAPYRRLREAIACGELLPNERLVEAELAQLLEAPRAAVRMAIVRLAQEDLVERLPHRGARVRRISEKEGVELLEARMALECLAAEHAARNITPEGIAMLRGTLAEMEANLNGDPLNYGALNARFHNEIVRIADHATAARLLETLRSRNKIFHFRSIAVPNDPRMRFKEHCDIVDAIAARDPKRAVAAMHGHLSDVAASLRAKL
jgi:DNA-binding GntR family transcriptional regulator